jgi:DNA-binding MarR family transcriptional regulator
MLLFIIYFDIQTIWKLEIFINIKLINCYIMTSRKERFAFCLNLVGKSFKKSACNSNDFPKDFSIKDISILHLLGEKPMMMSELADEMGLTPGTMTTKINSLIKKNFVERKYDEHDRRKIYIQLAKKGESTFIVIMQHHLDLSAKLLKKLNSEEQEILIKLTEKMITE